MKAPTFEVADVIRISGKEFAQKFNPLGRHKGVLTALALCRTEALGGHIYQCCDCGHQRIAYHSCRNRHCPKCQQVARERWALARETELLPVGYFHMVFTLPDTLNPLCLSHPEMMYGILFHAVRDTLFVFSADPRHLAAETGFVAVLHTWSQTLMLHPHLHVIIPAGGFNLHGQWVPARNNGNYLFPVKALSPVFRRKYRDALRLALDRDHIEAPPGLFGHIMLKNWVVYSKEPFAGPNEVVEYLARYTNRVAIGNHRLTSLGPQRLTFSYTDNHHGGVRKLLTLDNTEFLMRFCLHILPHGFVKIRHYGILSSRRKAEYIPALQKANIKTLVPIKLSWQEVCRQRLGFDPEICPLCGKGKMVLVGLLEPRPPPAWPFQPTIQPSN